MSGQLISELFPDCLKVMPYTLVLSRMGGDKIYEMRCPFVAVGLNACFIVLPHWANMSQAHMLTHWHRVNQLRFLVLASSWVPCKQGPLPFLTSLVWLDPAATGNRTHKSSWSVLLLAPPYRRLLRSAGATEELFDLRTNATYKARKLSGAILVKLPSKLAFLDIFRHPNFTNHRIWYRDMVQG